MFDLPSGGSRSVPRVVTPPHSERQLGWSPQGKRSCRRPPGAVIPQGGSRVRPSGPIGRERRARPSEATARAHEETDTHGNR
jgi:hypothetical protein